MRLPNLSMKRMPTITAYPYGEREESQGLANKPDLLDRPGALCYLAPTTEYDSGGSLVLPG